MPTAYPPPPPPIDSDSDDDDFAPSTSSLLRRSSSSGNVTWETYDKVNISPSPYDMLEIGSSGGGSNSTNTSPPGGQQAGAYPFYSGSNDMTNTMSSMNIKNDSIFKTSPSPPPPNSSVSVPVGQPLAGQVGINIPGDCDGDGDDDTTSLSNIKREVSFSPDVECSGGFAGGVSDKKESVGAGDSAEPSNTVPVRRAAGGRPRSQSADLLLSLSMILMCVLPLAQGAIEVGFCR